MTQNRNQDYRDRDYRSGRDYRSAAGRDQEIGHYWSRNDRDEGQGERGFDQGRGQDRYAAEYESEGRSYQGRNPQSEQGSWQGEWQNRQQSDRGRRAGSGSAGYGAETYGNQRPGGSYGSGSQNRSYDDWGYGPQERYAGRASQSGYFGTEGSGGYGTSSGNYDNFRSSGSYGASGNAANYGSSAGDFASGRDYESQWGGGSRYGSSSGSYGNHGYGSGSESYRGESYRGKGPKGYARSDDRLKELICERLTEDHGIDASDITVDVTGQSVKLTGSIDNRRAKYEVEELIERVGGVKDIDNQLKVQPRTGDTRGSDYSASGSTSGSRGTSADKSGVPGTRHN